MKNITTVTILSCLLLGFTIASHAGLSEDKNGVLHCSGKSSCNSLKTACKNGHADYKQTGPTTGTCTVGAGRRPNLSSVKGASDHTVAARRYQSLARQHKPTTPQQQRLVQQYMALPPERREAFKARHPSVAKSIWDYAPYAVCFYASVAGGADVVEAGDDCNDKWVD